jgi:hypothetical protein
MATLPPLGNPNTKLAGALKQLSSAKYGHPRLKVEEAIFDRMKTMTPPPAAKPFGSAPAAGPASPWSAPAPSPSPAAAHKPAPTGTGSFLDEWLQKRTTPNSAATAPARQPAAAAVAPAGAPPVSKPASGASVPHKAAPAAPQPSPAAHPSHKKPAVSHKETAGSHHAKTIQPPPPKPHITMPVGEVEEPTAPIVSRQPQAADEPKAAPALAPRPHPVEQPLPHIKVEAEEAEDTITIDQDGNLIYKDDQADKKS